MKYIVLLTLISICPPAFAASASAAATATPTTGAADEKRAAAAAPDHTSAEDAKSAADENGYFDFTSNQALATSHPAGTEFDDKLAAGNLTITLALMQRGKPETSLCGVPTSNGYIQGVPVDKLRSALQLYRNKIRWDSINGYMRIGGQTVPDYRISPLDMAIQAVAPQCVGLLLDAGAPARFAIIPKVPTSLLAVESWQMSLEDDQSISLTRPAEVILRMLLHAGASRRFVLEKKNVYNPSSIPEKDYRTLVLPAIAQVEREQKAWKEENSGRKAALKGTLLAFVRTLPLPIADIIVSYDVPLRFSYLEYAQDALAIPREQ